MEDDGERAQLLQSILDLLLARGYFRARISTLSTFDKLTGGLAWCITFSKVDVDFDILYDDDATLYYKIKVGEAIEEALQRMGCPHPLLAHQIQGLDYMAVLPVVQWLVKQVMATLEELSHQARRHAHLRFEENYMLPHETSLQESRLDKIEAVVQSSVQEPVREVLESIRVDLTRTEEHRDLDSASAKQAQSSQPEFPFRDARVSVSSAPNASPIDSPRDSSDSTKAAQQVEAELGQEVLSMEKHKEETNAKITELQNDLDAASESVKALQATIAQQDERMGAAQAAIDKLEATAKISGVESIVQKLMRLLETSQSLEKQAAQFRVECRRKRSEMQAQIRQLSDPSPAGPGNAEQAVEANGTYNIDLQKWKTLRSELSKRSRAVNSFQRRLDDLPSQTELMQYERRFVELYLHIQRKLRETRRYYSTYNALAEAQELTAKELSLLNSIHTQFEMAMTTPGGRSKFKESLEGIFKGVQQKLHQIERRYQVEQTTLTSLKEKHFAAVAAQRQYYSLVKLFQDECARGENLLLRLNKGRKQQQTR